MTKPTTINTVKVFASLVGICCMLLILKTSAFANDQMKNHITGTIGNQKFHIHVDNVTRRHVLGIPQCRGHEYWSDGKINNVLVEPTSASSAKVTLEYSGDYKRKHFFGVGCEYRNEHKRVHGKYHFEVTFRLFGDTITNNHSLSNFGEVSDRGHDSNKYTFDGLKALVVDKLGPEG